MHFNKDIRKGGFCPLGVDLVQEYLTRCSCDFIHLRANSVKGRWKIEHSSTSRQQPEQYSLGIHFIIVTTNRKDLNAERSRSILIHLGGPEWESMGREESVERRKTIPVMSLFSNKMRSGTSPSYCLFTCHSRTLPVLPNRWADKAKYDVKAAERSFEPPLNSGTAR